MRRRSLFAPVLMGRVGKVAMRGGCVISGDDLAEDLRLGRCGDLVAAGRVYDQTCADAWLLVRCVVPETTAAQGAMLRAYREVLESPTQPVPPLSSRAWVLSRVYTHAIAARQARDETGRPGSARRVGGASILGTFRVGCARLLAWASGSAAGSRGRRR